MALLHALRAVAEHGRPRIGVRERAVRALDPNGIVAALAGVPHVVMLSLAEAETLPSVVAALRHPGRELWVEVGSVDQLAAVADDLPIDGLVGVGAEAGGVCGYESTFVLAQHLARQSRPFMLRGGIGIHAAAACRVAGAAGVILDDALLLLPESPLTPAQRHFVSRLGTTDTTRIGRSPSVRVIDRPDAPGVRLLGLAASAGEVSDDLPPSAIDEVVGWGDPQNTAWPVGEAVALAPAIAARFPSVAQLVRALDASTRAAVRQAHTSRALAPGAPLAQAMGAALPVVQGPMTRVSDRVPFAGAVSDSGAVPLLALALARGSEVAALLDEANRTLSGRAWGVGILGFVPEALQAEQLREVVRARPPIILISGGRPDQAAALEALGLTAYLHVPAPLLTAFADAGVRHFVLEGGECGGHVGPLHSLTLWDLAVTVLAARTEMTEGEALHVLFAGGIHDDRSAAMVAALAAPLSAAGVNIGVLMGTAYLFTREAVSHGAILEAFQHQAVAAGLTTTIATGPGHVIRCAPTPFTATFERERATLVAQGLRGPALSDALEHLVVGRSRMASKGLDRIDGTLREVSAEVQLRDGMFMLGEVAALRHEPCTLAELHDSVTRGALRRLAGAVEPEVAAPMRRTTPRPADIAIVGMACLVPGASTPEGFWHNLLAAIPALKEIPRERWDWRLLFDEDPAARDRIYSKWGGFIDPVPFDPIAFGIPPRSLGAITIPQLLALETTRRALVDAGFGESIADAALRERTAVVFGTGNTADLEQLYMTRAALPLVVPGLDASVLARLPEWTEESYPGLLANVVAGRVANRFDFHGPNLTVDAACASSLAALDVAVRELVEGRSDLVVAGGIDFEQSPQAYMGFSRTRALSPRGRANVFDAKADGIVISEGAAVLVLRRLADAEREGQRIYAVIKAVAGSSDGRGLSLTAPKPGGQQLALERAYATAGVPLASISLYEAHGTGTAVGDSAEVESIGGLLATHGAVPGACAIGSLKSLLGHTRCAAGMVATAKAALALHHRTLPPHVGIAEPLPALQAPESPLAVCDAARPWLGGPTPRRAGVSAFGFGGTNFHTVLEEHATAIPAGAGGDIWPAELFALTAVDTAAAIARIDRLIHAAQILAEYSQLRQPLPCRLADLACTVAAANRGPAEIRLALVASTVDDLIDTARRARACLLDPSLEATGVFIGRGPVDGAIGWLFPGQGSQYPGMGRELAVYLPEVREAVERAAAESVTSPRLETLIWPATAFSADVHDRQRRALADTRVAQPAIGALSAGLLALLNRLHLEPKCVAGHSYGEFVALHAAGCLSQTTLHRLSAVRGRAMADMAVEAGGMAVLALSADDAATVIAGWPRVQVANINAPTQVVVSGPIADVQAVVRHARDRGLTCAELSVSGAFHTPLMQPARRELAAALRAAGVTPPQRPVHGNLDGMPYPADPVSIVARLESHLESRVDFVAQVRAMYEAGVRTFLEVGPGHVLTGLVGRILEGSPHRALSLDGGLRHWLQTLASLHAYGHTFDAAALFAYRRVRVVDLETLILPKAPGWYVDGGRVWAHDATSRTVGVLPFLDADTARSTARDDDRAPATWPTSPLLGQTPEEQTALEAYVEYERTMRQFLDQQERMLASVLSRVPTESAGDASQTVVVRHRREALEGAPEQEQPTVPDRQARFPSGMVMDSRDARVARLLQIVVDRTGYAEAALGLDLDLEADLGIDSIKRIDIMSSLIRDLPADRARALQPKMDRLTRLRSLGAVLRLLDETLEATSADALRAEALPRPAPRLVPVMVEAPAPDAPARLNGLHIVIDDGGGLAGHLATGITQRGGTAEVIDWVTASSRAALTDRLEALRGAHGLIRSLAVIAVVPEVARAASAVAFTALQLCASDLESTGPAAARVMAVTGMGGDWCRSRGSRDAALAAGCHGVLRTFEREYPDVRTVVVDLEPQVAVAAADRVLAEWLSADEAREVGLVGRQRLRGSLREGKPASGASSGLLPCAGWVVLATGGAQGITAAVSHAIAAPGVHFVMCGRRSAETLSDGVWAPLIARGATFEYHAVDVRDQGRFGQLIDGVYERHGRLDAVLHGAGVIDDQRFDRKTEDAFARVFDTKVKSALTLADHLRGDSLRWLALFGSVSGRFGNPGQADYAAANEVLIRLGWALQRAWPSCRVLGLNWGPWAGGGMVTPSTAELLASRGMQPLSIEEGCRLFREELERQHGDVEVVLGHGPWSVSLEQGLKITGGGAGAILSSE